MPTPERLYFGVAISQGAVPTYRSASKHFPAPVQSQLLTASQS